jgi:hypothetical protein
MMIPTSIEWDSTKIVVFLVSGGVLMIWGLLFCTLAACEGGGRRVYAQQIPASEVAFPIAIEDGDSTEVEGFDGDSIIVVLDGGEDPVSHRLGIPGTATESEGS